MIEKTEIRYLVVPPAYMTGKYSFILPMDGDGELNIAELGDASVCYPRLEFGQVDDNIRVLSVLISKKLEQEFEWQVDIPNPMSDENEMATVFCLDIAYKTFRSLDTVRAAYPQTDGTFEVTSVDEDGVETVTIHDKMKDVNWAI